MFIDRYVINRIRVYNRIVRKFVNGYVTIAGNGY